jgi:hypothetical protein
MNSIIIPFVDDKLKRLMREKLKTFLQPMVLSTSMTRVGVPIQQTQTQPRLVTNPILVNQHLNWPQPITPLIAKQPRIVLYPMLYNTIPSFVFMDPNMYAMYYTRIKGLDPLISRRKKDM